MAKFLSDLLVKGIITADNGLVLGAGKNISTTNQAYLGATNYINSIVVGWDAAAVYLGYSMGSLPIHIGTNGSGNLVVRTSGNTVIESGNLLVGTATNSGFKLDVNGQARFSDHVVINTDPAYFSGSAYNGYKVLGIGSTIGGGLSFVSSNGVAAEVFGDNTPTGLYLASYGVAPVITFWLNTTEVGKFVTTGELQLTTLAGTGTRMVVADTAGKLSVQSVPTFSESDTLDTVTFRGANTLNEISVGGLAVGQTTVDTGTKLTVNGATHVKNGYLYGNAASGGDFGFYPETGYYELSAPAGPNQGVIFVLNGKHTGKQIGFYTGDTNYTGMLLYEQAPVGGDLAYWTTDKWVMTPNHNMVWAASTGLAIAQGPYDIGLTREAAGLLQINTGTVGTYANLKLAGLTASTLAGSGTRMVVANGSGVLGTQALPVPITNYVTTDTTQTISGQKTFSALTTIFDSTQTATFIEGKASGVLYGGISFSIFMQFNAYAAATQGFLWKNGLGSNVMALSQTGVLNLATLAGSGTRMVVADLNGNLGVQSIPTGSLQGAVDADKNTSGSLAAGTTIVKSVSASTYSGVFFDYVVKNGTNVRVGSVVAITNGTTVESYETLSNDIGSTSGLTFTVTLGSGNINLNAVAATTGFTVIVSTRAI